MFRTCNEHRGEDRGSPPSAVLAILVAAAVALASTVAASNDPSADQVTVRPGGVVRWSGDGITACDAFGREYQPLAGACWYPVDLLSEPGPISLTRTRHGFQETVTVMVDSYPYPVQRLSVAPEMAEPPPEQTERIRRESLRVGAIWNRGGQPAFALPLQPPITPLPEARGFGARRVFNGKPRSPHRGVDLSAVPGTPVGAAAAGTVVIAENHYFSGNSVFIDHGDDLVTMYFHLDVILAAKGDRVRPGEVIGTVGATGRVTGPHLHFGVRWRGAVLDPMVLLADPPKSLPQPP